MNIHTNHGNDVINSNLLNGNRNDDNNNYKFHHNLPPLDESLYDLHYKINNGEIYNVLQMIKYWADKQPNKVAYHWIEKSDCKVTKSYTYSELWKEIESIKYRLENEWKVKKGDNVFIVYPPGLEFIFAFFGCMLAGCVAVPVYPPVPGRTLKKGVDKLKLLQESCHAKVALTSKSYNVARRTSKILSFKAKWPKDLKWYITDNIKWKPKYVVNMNEINIDENAVAFLQYTSGSTGDPKGVMILHKNIFQNILVAIHHVALKGSNTIGMCWVPQYHDMGLIGCYTTTICGGGTQYAISPFTFLQQPSLWIHCLSKYKCEVTSAPNFAFELAVRKWHAPKDGHNIDLSHLMVFGSGGEPIRLDTVNKFYILFTKYGLNRGVIHPVFGMAESCLYVTFARNILTHTDHRGIQRVCSGNVDVVKFKFGVDICIINSETGEEVKDDEEGEIIISSQSIAAGYMNRPQLSKETFQFQLPNNSEDKYYLKTGDLGMIVKPDREWSIAHPDRHPIHGQDDKLLEEELNQRHLVITGRIKDLIILNGRNYYPQDIELCVEHALTNKQLVRSGCVVATSIEWNNAESFAVVCELRKDVLAEHIKDEKKKNKKLTKELILKQICIEMIKAIHNEFGAKPCIVALIKEKTIPKTTSGKVRRKATATALLSIDKNTQLKLIHQYEVESLNDINSSRNERNTITVNTNNHVETVHNAIANTAVSASNTNTNSSVQIKYSVDEIKTRVYDILNEILMLDSDGHKDADHKEPTTRKVNNNNNNVKDDDDDDDDDNDVPIDINDNTPFSDMGLASMDTVTVSERLEEMFDIELDGSVLFSYPTIQQLSEYIFASKAGLKTLISSRGRARSRSFSTTRNLSLMSPSSVNGTMNDNNQVAIVGMSCKTVGGTNNLKEFWSALVNGVDLIKESTYDGRHDLETIGAGLNKSTVESFDNNFFNISKKEAHTMSAHQRLLLTTTWEACHNAGIDTLDYLKGESCGVFIGVSGNDTYVNEINAFSASANATSIIANRISYVFGINGPSMTIDTACSSVLVAFRQAILSITSGDCDYAIVGGINLLNSKKVTNMFKTMGVISSSLCCKSFDTSLADGYVRSEGCGVLILKRLSEAKLDEDRILCVHQGSAVISNGSGMSLTAPNGEQQEQTILQALSTNDIETNSIDIIEAHGTATKQGDTIELQAIHNVFISDDEYEMRKRPLYVTTAKTNVGHSETASGALSLIKAILQINYCQIPRLLHFESNQLTEVTSDNDTQNTIIIPKELHTLTSNTKPLRIGVNSFGFGGTNAHVVLEGMNAKASKDVIREKQVEWNFNQFVVEHSHQVEQHESHKLEQDINVNAEDTKLVQSKATDVDDQILNIVYQHVVDDRKIAYDESLLDLGLSSLSLTVIANELSSKLNRNVTIATLVRYPSIRQLSTALNNKSDQELSGGYSDDFWNQEIYLPPEVKVDGSSKSVSEKQQYLKDVFLTGATGFLGGQLLLQLLFQTNATIHCLIRGKSVGNIQQRLLTVFHKNEIPRIFIERVHCYVGDLGKSRLGLDNESFNTLSKLCDTVVHCGAIVDWVLPYSKLKDVNVNGTIEILKFAVRNKIKILHHISTEGIFPRHPNLKSANENAPLASASTLISGYRQSKWVAEQIIHLAIKRGVPVHGIYRTGVISGHSVSSLWTIDDAFTRIIQTNSRISLMPDISTGILTVDFLAKAIVRGVINGKLETNGPVYNLANARPVDMNQWIEVANIMGFYFKEIPYKEWRQKVIVSKDSSLRVISILHEVDNEPYKIGTPLDPIKTDKWLLQKHQSIRPEITSALMRLYSEWVFTQDVKATKYEINESKDHFEPQTNTSNSNMSVNKVTRYGIQFVWWLFVLFILGVMFLPIITSMRYTLHEYGFGLSYMTLALFGGAIIYALELILFTVLCKWLILGRSKPGTHRVWSSYFIRWWCVSSLIRLTNMFVGFFLQNTAYYSWFLRLLGANIGDKVIIDTTKLEDVDLLTIGDDVIIEGLSRISCNTFDINSNDQPVLILGPITIGSNCMINHKCVIESNTNIEDAVELLAGTYVSNGSKLITHSKYKGLSACSRSGDFNHFEFRSKTTCRLVVTLDSMTMLLHVIAMLAYVFLGCIFITTALYPTNWIYDEHNTFGAAFFLSMLPIIVMYEYAIAAVVFKWLLIGRVTSESKNFNSTLAVRMWFVDRFMIALSLNQFVLGANAIYMDWLYWLLGQTCGQYCIRSNAYFGGSCIDLIKLDEQVIIGNDVMFVPYKFEGHKIVFQEINVHNSALIGGQTVIYGDVVIEKKGVIGTNSVVYSETRVKTGDMLIEHEIRFHTNIPDDAIISNTKPSHLWYITFGLLVPIVMHLLRFICCIPCGYLLSEIIIEESHISDWRLHVLPEHWKLIPMSHWAVLTYEYLYFLSALLFTVVIAFVSRFVTNFGSTNEQNNEFFDNEYYCWRLNIEILSQCLMENHVSTPMLINGTELLPMLSKIFGAEIGNNVYWNPSFISNFSLIKIGSDSVLNQCYLWPHTLGGIHFRVKDKRQINISNNCVIEYNAQLLPNVKVGSFSKVNSNSVLFSGQYINTISQVYGNPAIMELRTKEFNRESSIYATLSHISGNSTSSLLKQQALISSNSVSRVDMSSPLLSTSSTRLLSIANQYASYKLYNQ